MPSVSAASGQAWGRRYGMGVVPHREADDVTLGLLAHKSVRAFLEDPLPHGVIENAIAAAQSASSSSNLQAWSVIAVEDSERKARLSRLAGEQAHIRQAPVLLVWLVDLARIRRIGESEGVPTEGLDYFDTFLVGAIDAALAAQNAVVSLEAQGLGVVYIGALRNQPEAVAEELALPPLTTVAFGLSVGVPDRSVPAHVKPRLPQSVVFHRERYDASAERTDLTHYDRQFALFQRDQGLPGRTWSVTALSRVRHADSLHGRDRLRQALSRAGFALK